MPKKRTLLPTMLVLLALMLFGCTLVFSESEGSASLESIDLSNLTSVEQVLSPEYPLNIVCFRFVKDGLVMPIYKVFEVNRFGEIRAFTTLPKPLLFRGRNVSSIMVSLVFYLGKSFGIKLVNVSVKHWFAILVYKVMTPVPPCSAETEVCTPGRIWIKYKLFNESFALIEVHVKHVEKSLASTEAPPGSPEAITISVFGDYQIRFLVNLENGQAYLLEKGVAKPIGVLPLLPPLAIKKVFRDLVSRRVHMLIERFKANTPLIDLLVEKAKTERNLAETSSELMKALGIDELDTLLRSYRFYYGNLSLISRLSWPGLVVSEIVLPLAFPGKCIPLHTLYRELSKRLPEFLRECLIHNVMDESHLRCLSLKLLGLVVKLVMEGRKEPIIPIVEIPLTNSSDFADIVLPVATSLHVSNEFRKLRQVDYLVVSPFAALASAGSVWIDSRLNRTLLDLNAVSCLTRAFGSSLKLELSRIVYRGLTEGWRGSVIADKLSEKLLERLRYFNECIEALIPPSMNIEHSRSTVNQQLLPLQGNWVILAIAVLCVIPVAYLVVRARVSRR